MRKLLFAVFFSFLSLHSASQALADVQINRVKNFISNVGNEIIKSANDESVSVEQRQDNIISVIDQSIDANWISRFVLGKNYRTASPEHRVKFTKLYREFMINTYGPKFQDYNGQKFTVTSVARQGRFYITKAEFLPKDSNTEILVSFRVKERKGKLVILDFIAEGISLIETQRSEFNSAISQKGMENFLQDLETRTKNLKEKNNKKDKS